MNSVPAQDMGSNGIPSGLFVPVPVSGKSVAMNGFVP